MTLKEKIEFLEEVMDLDEEMLTQDMDLEDVDEWDSLSVLSLTVEMKKRYGINLTTEIIKTFKTVEDICNYIPD